MNKPILIIFLYTSIFASTICTAQNVELSASINGSLYNYTGSATDDPVFGLNSYYNKNLRAGYGGNLQLNWVSKKGFIAGLQSGFDVLQNKQQFGYYLDLATFDYYLPPPPITRYSLRYFTKPASGYEVTDLKMINVNPYLGYRFKKGGFKIDVIAGAEAAYNIKYDITNHGTDWLGYFMYPSNLKQQADYRLKGGFSLHYKKTAINLTYAHGLTNFLKGETYVGPYGKPTFPASAYSQLIKLGVSYKIL